MNEWIAFWGKLMIDRAIKWMIDGTDEIFVGWAFGLILNFNFSQRSINKWAHVNHWLNEW